MKIFSLSFLLAFSINGFQNITVKPNIEKHQGVKERIKVYPTPDNEGSVTIYSDNKASLSFYLFNVEGKLIYQTRIAQNEKQTVEGLQKGTYLYNAFENDKNLEGGKVILK